MNPDAATSGANDPGLRRFLRRWYVLSAVRETLPIFAVYALYMQASGLSPYEISALFVVWSIAAFVLEVPSGVLADRYERVTVLTVSRVLQVAAFAVWWVHPQFAGFALGFVLWGFAGALWSGTGEAWLYEALHARGAAERFEGAYARTSAFATAGVCAALLCGGRLAEFGYAVPLAVSIVASFAVAAALPFCLPRVPRAVRETASVQSPPLRAALADFRARPTARAAAAALAFGFVFFACFEEYVGLVFDAEGLSLAVVGYAYAGCYAARALAMEAVGRFADPARERDALVPLAWSGVVLGVGALLASSPLGLAALVAGSWVYFAANGVAEVRIVDALQRAQSGAGRATVMSLARVGLLATGPVVYGGLAVVAQHHGWGHTVAFTAVCTTLVAGLLALARRGGAR